MSTTFQQRESGLFVYPRSAWRKLAWRLPLLLWRLGLSAIFHFLPMIVLTTRGRKTGVPRRVMIEHSFLNGRIYVTPGWGPRTQWYRNLAADPRVTVQRGRETFAALACRVTEEDELTALFHYTRATSPMWKPFLDSWGIEDRLEDFLSKRDRVFTLRLDRAEGLLPLPPLRADLWWVLPVLAASVLLLLRWLV